MGSSYEIMRKIVVRLKGGLGNQLFCYAAARGVAVRNGLELVIDNVSGFVRDQKYCRSYSLANFKIPARLAKPSERLEPFERYRRAIAKWRARRIPFEKRSYLEQEFRDFDARLLTLKPRGNMYIDGLWQSEGYFKDIESVIRQELTFRAPSDQANQDMFRRIVSSGNPVALHVRWFDDQDAVERSHNLTAAYYERALAFIRSNIDHPHFFLFSDNPTATVSNLSLSEGSYTVVSHNVKTESAYADMWLMSQCRHFITANSTFSWWGAWLGEREDSMVIAPDPNLLSANNAWGLEGLLPKKWILM